MGCSTLRNVKELIDDLGIRERDKEALKEDVFTYLDKHTGCLERTLKLTAPEIKRLSKSFIGSDRGTIYFARRGLSKEWKHNSTRSAVESALPDLVRRWIRNKKDTIQRNDNIDQTKTSRPSVAAISSKHSSASSRSAPISTLLPPKKAMSAESAKRRKTIKEVEDDDKNFAWLPDIPYGPESTDDSSLPDVETVIRSARKPATTIRDRFWSITPAPEAEPVLASDMVPDAPFSYEVVEPAASDQATRSATETIARSPPLTKSKRAHTELDVAVVDEDEPRAESKAEGRKRARHRYDSDDEPISTMVIVSNPRTGSTVHEELPTEDQAIQQPPTLVSAKPQASHATHQTAPYQSQLLTTNLSDTNASSQQLILGQDDLLRIPSIVLDYIRRCERATLNKMNVRELDNVGRTRQKERCKLFRDLHADIESRIASLSHPMAKKEAHTGIEDDDLQPAGIIISSYALWD